MHENDVYIGDNKWILWIEYDYNIQDDFDVENHLQSMQPFWQNMMTECDSECCGIHAYDFTKVGVQKAIQGLSKTQITNQLYDLRKIVNANEKTLVSSRILNHRLMKNIFLELIDHLSVSVAD